MVSWECKYLHIRRWEEVAANAHTHQSSASCTYYWKNKHLIKDFVSHYPDLRYYWGFSLEGQQRRNKIFNPKNEYGLYGLNGYSGPAYDVIHTLKKTFDTSYDSKNFPYNFNPNTVCQGCKFYLNEEYNGDGM